jgi:hypothetical protein
LLARARERTVEDMFFDRFPVPHPEEYLDAWLFAAQDATAALHGWLASAPDARRAAHAAYCAALDREERAAQMLAQASQQQALAA